MYTAGGNLNLKLRLGIVGNNELDCTSADSFVGLGAKGGLNYVLAWCGTSYTNTNAAGNLAQCGGDNGNKNSRAMAYVLVR